MRLALEHPLVPRGKELGPPIVSGILLAISFPPFHLLIPPFVALVPFLVFAARVQPDRSGSRSVARAAFWMGVVYYGMLLYWLFTALVWYTWLSLLGYIITVVVLSGFLSAGGYAIHRMRWRHGMPFWITAPIFIVAVEWLRAHLGHLAFPWLGLGHSLTGFPYLVGFADVTGARGVTLWLAAINGLIAEWYLEGWKTRLPRRAAALALLIAIPIGYSLIRWATLETRAAARVLVVQPNIPEDLKLDRRLANDTSKAALGELTRVALSEDENIELVVWPETAHPDFFEIDRDWTYWTAGTVRYQWLTPLVYGTLDIERYRDGSYDYYNAALYLNAQGNNSGLYQKNYLVPVVERVPFVPIAWMRRLRRNAEDWELPIVGNIGAYLRWFGGFGSGDVGEVMELGDSRFGILICYESIFPQHARRYRKNGADFLLNITNDSWFGRSEPWWSQTAALYQHPAHMVMRAIENRIGVARAANTGISGFIDPRGRAHQMTELFEPATEVREVETTAGLTLYTRLGDWIGWLCAFAAIGLMGWSLRMERRMREDVTALTESTE